MTKLLLLSKIRKNKNGVEFKTFFTQLELENEQKIYVTIKFTKNINTFNLSNGYLELENNDYDLYLDADFPFMWIKNFTKFTPRENKKKEKEDFKFKFVLDDKDEKIE